MNPQKTHTVDEAQKKLEHFCAYQERCHKEVVEKLKNMRMIPDAIDVIVVHLIQNNFLNEARFAKAYVRGKFRIKKWGRKRLEIELKKREISSFNIQEAFKEISEAQYLETFHELAEKKVATITETNIYKKRKKLVDYLLYRGWESHLAFQKAHDLIQ